MSEVSDNETDIRHERDENMRRESMQVAEQQSKNGDGSTTGNR